MYNLMGHGRFRKNVANYDRWTGYRGGQLYSFHCIGLCAYTAKHSRREAPSSWLSTYRRTKIWTSIKQTTRRLQSWGRKMPFIGKISTSEEDIFYDSLSLFFVVYIFSSFPSSIIFSFTPGLRRVVTNSSSQSLVPGTAETTRQCARVHHSYLTFYSSTGWLENRVPKSTSSKF
jgi:hypothetical protein